MSHSVTARPQKDLPEPSLGKTGRQARFLEAFAAENFNISKACRQAGINRRTFYRWKDESTEFREQVEEIVKLENDLIEEKLFEIAVEGKNVIALIFLAKALCGYVERTKVDHAIESPRLSTEQIDAVVNAARISGIHAPRLLAPEPSEGQRND